MPEKGDTAIGLPHRHYRSTDSTNTRARELAAAGAPHGTIVTAEEQNAGRGRQGRTWTAPPGKALLYSAIVRPLEERHTMLPLAVPLAVCEAAEELEPEIECGVKWPNDVLVEGRKLAGVLIEARPQDSWAVIGIGLNLTIAPDEFPTELRDTAVSLFGSVAGREGAGLSRHSTASHKRAVSGEAHPLPGTMEDAEPSPLDALVPPVSTGRPEPPSKRPPAGLSALPGYSLGWRL